MNCTFGSKNVFDTERRRAVWHVKVVMLSSMYGLIKVVYEDFTVIPKKARVCFIPVVKELCQLQNVEVGMSGKSCNTIFCFEQDRSCGLRLQRKVI